MSNNIFLEGPIQTGKSTLIRKTLGSHIRNCGGFASQRLVDASGNILGFRIGPARVTPINATVCYAGAPADSAINTHSPSRAANLPKSLAGSPSVATISSKPPACPLIYPDGTMPDNVFKYRTYDGSMHDDTQVFNTAGLKLLEVRSDDRFMLLDEIGGVELACEPFMDALIKLLRSPVPCVGVLKLRINVERIGDPALLSAYDELRSIISSEPDSHILYHRERL